MEQKPKRKSSTQDNRLDYQDLTNRDLELEITDHKLNETQKQAQLKNDPFTFFVACLVAGAVSCGVTRALLTPLDVVRIRMSKKKTNYPSIYKGLRIMYKEGGLSNLYIGWVPTLIGNAMNGSIKFFTYEFMKYNLRDIHGHRLLICSVAAVTAESLSALFFVPFEEIRLRMQTSSRFSNKSMVFVMQHIYRTKGASAFYRTLIPIWFKAVPFQILKFLWFEVTAEYLYQHIPEAHLADKWQHLMVTFAAGCLSGVVVAILTQPADYVVSKLIHKRHATVIGILMKAGFFGIWKGWLRRMAVFGILTGLQLFSYDLFKILSVSFTSLFISLLVQDILNVLLDFSSSA